MRHIDITATKCIIFDFDGTLANCTRLHQDAFRMAVETLLPGITYDEMAIEALPTTEKMKRLRDDNRIEFDFAEFNRLKQQATMEGIGDYIHYREDLFDELSRLYNWRIPLCVASNATQTFIHSSLRRMGVWDLFSKINTATEMPAKPDPYTFVDCMNHFDANARNTVIFEDSELGIASARKVCKQVMAVAGVDSTIEHIRMIR